MKKDNSYKKYLAAVLALSMVFSSLAGCSSKEPDSESEPESSVSETEPAKETEAPTEAVTTTKATTTAATTAKANDASLLASIKSNFTAAVLDETYNKGLYDLPEDYVFEFPCSKDAESASYRAFAVYATQDYTEAYRTYHHTTVEDGVMKVAPGGVVQLNAEGSKDVTNGSWGSLNQLYLVQYIDLDTGLELEKPIVTPFTVKHDVKSPVVSQNVDEKNNYTLSWKPVPDAVEYAVYEYFGGSTYNLCCTTDSTSVSIREFEKQQFSDELLELFKQDLENAGYDMDPDGLAVMNSTLHTGDTSKLGGFTVIALDEDGNASGISNIVEVKDIAAKLPYTISENVLNVEISDINDVPAYVNVEMIDGSETQMIIDYHGAQTYKYPDEPNKISVKAHVANTEFDNFLIVMTGMAYDDVIDQISVVTQREDDLLANVRSAEQETGSMERTDKMPENNEKLEKPTEKATEGEKATEPAETTEASEPEVTTEAVEGSTEAEVTTEAAVEEITEEETEEPTEVEVTTEAVVEETTEAATEKATEAEKTTEAVKTTEAPETTENTTKAKEEKTTAAETKPDNTSTTPQAYGDTPGEQLMAEVEQDVTKTINDLGADKIGSILYAESDLEAWIAYCLIAQSDIVPVSTVVFPEAANLDYLFDVFLEAYRQNPTSGIIDINNIKYNDEYEALIIPYVEDPAVRLEKTKKELAKAEEIVKNVIKPSMSDYDKVYALNEYFRTNASYDQSSMSTDVDMNSLSESFIDAHTPYGILCNNYGVCESYSEAFILTSRMADLVSIAEIGSLFGGGHEWNRVKVDGKWCVLDITNNDNDDYVNGLFNLSDEQIKGILVPEQQAVVDPSKFKADTAEKEYYYVNGKCAKDLDEAKKLLVDILKTEDSATVRVPMGTTEEQATSLMRDVANEGTGITKGGFLFGLVTVMK